MHSSCTASITKGSKYTHTPHHVYYNKTMYIPWIEHTYIVHTCHYMHTHVTLVRMKWLCTNICESCISKMVYLCCFFTGCPEPVSLPHWLLATTEWGLQDDRGLPDVSWPHRYSSMCREREACTGHNWDCVRLQGGLHWSQLGLC